MSGCGNKPAMSTDKERSTPKKPPPAPRAARLKSALRENLKRRKAQARARDVNEER